MPPLAMRLIRSNRPIVQAGHAPETSATVVEGADRRFAAATSLNGLLLRKSPVTPTGGGNALRCAAATARQ